MIWKDYKEGEAGNETIISTSVIESDGVPIAIPKYKYHITMNANGEIAVEKEKGTGEWVCLNNE